MIACKRSLLILALAACAESPDSPPTVPRLADLPPGSKASVTYTNSGCWHFSQYQFTLQGDQPGNIQYEQVTDTSEPRPLTGELKIDPSLLDQLDLPLDFLRNPNLENGEVPAYGEEVKIHWPSGQVETHETAAFAIDKEWTLGFDDLIEQIETSAGREPWGG